MDVQKDTHDENNNQSSHFNIIFLYTLLKKIRSSYYAFPLQETLTLVIEIYICYIII